MFVSCPSSSAASKLNSPVEIAEDHFVKFRRTRGVIIERWRLRYCVCTCVWTIMSYLRLHRAQNLAYIQENGSQLRLGHTGSRPPTYHWMTVLYEIAVCYQGSRDVGRGRDLATMEHIQLPLRTIVARLELLMSFWDELVNRSRQSHR